MPQVNVGTTTVSALAATRATGQVAGTVVNRGPNSVWCDLAKPNTDVTPGAGDGNSSELRLGESVDVQLHSGEALRCRCAAGESARLDVFQSSVG